MTRALARRRAAGPHQHQAVRGPDPAGDLAAVEEVSAAVQALTAGRPVVLLDPSLPEHPGLLLAAARHVTVTQIAFMVRHTSGVLCVPLGAADCDRLGLPPMVRQHAGSQGSAFTVSVDAAVGGTTGISAADRARTIGLLADPAAGPDEFSRPGHVFPVRARPGGVLERPATTEAAVDLTRLAGAGDAAVSAAIVHDDDADVTLADTVDFAHRHGLLVVGIPALVRYRQLHDDMDARPDGPPGKGPGPGPSTPGLVRSVRR